MGGGLQNEPRIAGFGGRRREFRRPEVRGSLAFRAAPLSHGGARGAVTGPGR